MPRTYQIHLVKLNSEFWETHVLFWDFLRTHPNAAQQYEALKRDKAVKFRADRERGTDSKTPLIEQFSRLQSAGPTTAIYTTVKAGITATVLPIFSHF